jgi:hypothetical protein
MFGDFLWLHASDGEVENQRRGVRVQLDDDGAGAIKLHALLDHEGNIPSFVRVTAASTHEIHEGRKLRLEPDSIVTFDRGYVDRLWFAQIAAQGAYFVTRLKRGMAFHVLARRRPPSLSGVTCDQTIRLRANEPDSIRSDLRRVGNVDPGTGRRYFLTNAFHLSAKTIAEILDSDAGEVICWGRLARSAYARPGAPLTPRTHQPYTESVCPAVSPEKEKAP